MDWYDYLTARWYRDLSVGYYRLYSDATSSRLKINFNSGVIRTDIGLALRGDNIYLFRSNDVSSN